MLHLLDNLPMSLRQGFGGKTPNVPHREAIKEKSSQGAKRYLTVGLRKPGGQRRAAPGAANKIARRNGCSGGLCYAIFAAGTGGGFKPLCHGRNCRLRLRSGLRFWLRTGTLGDFIPQTPSLGTRPQTPSSLRACCSILFMLNSISALHKGRR